MSRSITRIITPVLLVIILILQVASMTMAVEEIIDPSFVVSTVKAMPGETVDVEIAIRNCPGITSAKLVLEYDNEALTLNEVAFNTAELGGMSSVSKDLSSPVILNWFDGLEDVEGDVVYATLNFTISEDIAVDSSYKINVTYDANDVCNVYEENVSMDVVGGKINVITRIPGDVNGDKAVDNKDLIRLMQYLTYGDEVEIY